MMLRVWIVLGVSGGASTYGAPAAGGAEAASRDGRSTGGAVEREGRVEPEETGALLEAGVATGLRVAVEVPAGEGGGQRAAQRMPSTEDLAGPAALAGDLAPQDLVPVADRAAEPVLAQESRLLAALEAAEAAAFDLAVAEVVAERDPRVAGAGLAADAAMVLEAVGAAVERPELDVPAACGGIANDVAGKLVKGGGAAEETRDRDQDGVGLPRQARSAGIAEAQVAEPIAATGLGRRCRRERSVQAHHRLLYAASVGSPGADRDLDSPGLGATILVRLCDGSHRRRPDECSEKQEGARQGEPGPCADRCRPCRDPPKLPAPVRLPRQPSDALRPPPAADRRPAAPGAGSARSEVDHHGRRRGPARRRDQQGRRGADLEVGPRPLSQRCASRPAALPAPRGRGRLAPGDRARARQRAAGRRRRREGAGRARHPLLRLLDLEGGHGDGDPHPRRARPARHR